MMRHHTTDRLCFVTLLWWTSSAMAGSFAEQAAKLDDPAAFQAVVKAGTAAVPDVAARLNSPRADLAVLALGTIADAAATGPLAAIAGDADPQLRASIAWALGNCGGAGALEPLVKLAADPQAAVRAAAAGGLAQLKQDPADAALRTLVADTELAVRHAVAVGVRRAGRTALAGDLAARLAYRIDEVPDEKDPQKINKVVVWAEPDAQVRRAIIAALADVKVADTLPRLIDALERETSLNRLAIVAAIESQGPNAAGVCLGRIVPMAYVKESFEQYMPVLVNNGTLAVIAGRMGDERCVPDLMNTLKLPRDGLGKEPDLTELYIETVQLLGKFRAERAAAPLAELLAEARVTQLSAACQEAVRSIGRRAARPLAAALKDWQLAPVYFRLLREPELRTAAAREKIVEYLQHESDEVRLEATETLGLYLYEGILNEYDLALLESMNQDPVAQIRTTSQRWRVRIAKRAVAQ